MNDLDLRTALHRDADLVGAPPADLLDQLARRRQHERRQRAGMLTAAAAVVVIAAGIPVGASLLTRSDSAPATRPADTTPSTTSSAAPTPPPPAAPAPPVEVSQPPMTPVEPETPATTPAAEDAAPPCLDAAGFRKSLIASGVDPGGVEVNPLSPAPDCSGPWAYALLTEVRPDGIIGPNGLEPARTEWTLLFHAVDGVWTPVDRWQHCAAGDVPADIAYIPCETD
jgi:hypothetical protein